MDDNEVFPSSENTSSGDVDETEEYSISTLRSLKSQIFNFVYAKRPGFMILYTLFWDSFKLKHPNVTLSSVELKILFFEKLLPAVNELRFLTVYQTEYFQWLYNFYRDIDIDKLKMNDPIPGYHYHRADDNDTYLSLVNRSDVTIIGVTENVNCDLNNDSNLQRLFTMSNDLRILFSKFLRDDDEIQNNIILDDDEIRNRLEKYLAANKPLPPIEESEYSSPTKIDSQSISSNSHSETSILTSSRIIPSKSTRGSIFATSQMSPIVGNLFGTGNKTKRKCRDTKTLKKMRATLKNPKLKEIDRKVMAAKRITKRY